MYYYVVWYDWASKQAPHCAVQSRFVIYIYMYVGKYVGLSRKTHTKNMYAKIRTYVAQTRDVQSQFWVVKTDL